jgi:hypothetical protein
MKYSMTDAHAAAIRAPTAREPYQNVEHNLFQFDCAARTDGFLGGLDDLDYFQIDP